MSIGCGGSCRKFVEDDEFAIYEYYAYNLNEEKFANAEKIFDGFITIKKSCLVEPILQEKIKKLPSGRKKKMTKKILTDISLKKLIESGDVQIENCSHAWRFLPNGLDYAACKLCCKIFFSYQLEGKLPEKCGWHV